MGSYSAFARVYDTFTDNVDYAKMARRFDSLIMNRAARRGILLDLACGTGTLSCEMAKLGYDVIGVDASPEMLSVASQKAMGQDIIFICQRMEQLDLYGTVDACVCSLDSLNHLDSLGALERVFERVSLFLSPGGVFVFDMNTPYKHEKVLAQNSFVYESPDTLLVWRNATEGLVTEVSLDFFFKQRDGRYLRQSESFFERAFELPQIKHALSKAGLSIPDIYGEDGDTPPDAFAERYIFVCGKET